VPPLCFEGSARSIIEIDVAHGGRLCGRLHLAAHDRTLHAQDVAIDVDVCPANRDQFG